MKTEEGREGAKVCVTGAGGYIKSWLVKNLLQKGYTVNATLRDPQNGAKAGPLLSLPGAAERLKLFQADLREEGSFDSAVEGCEGVFHVADLTIISKLISPDDFIEHAVKGVLNVLKACSRAKSVRRVVYTSSMAGASPLNEEGKLTGGCFVDESVWTPVDFMRRKQTHPLGFYYAAKTLAEQAALEYGLNRDIEIVTIGPGFVAGPGLSFTFPTSCNAVLGLITGHYQSLKLTETFLGSIPFVHIEDTCEAHIFLMEQPNVEGRHICSARSLTFPQLIGFMDKRYPHFNLQFKSEDEEADSVSVPISCKKLLDMGFSYKYGLEDIFDETIKYAQSLAIL